jgi:predicted PurR-regulated permease PerM
LIPILSFFFLKDGAAIRKGIVDSFSHANQTVVNEIFVDLHLLLAQYIRALVLLVIATFLFYSGFLSLASVPYAILLAGIAAIFEFIPVVGPLTASAAILLVAAFTGYPHLLWIAIFLVIYRIFQDYVLSPFLMSAGVEIHPLLILFGVLAGEQIAGVPGMFFSAPVIAALRVFYVRLRRQRRAGAD